MRMMSARRAARRQLQPCRSRSLCQQACPPSSIFISVRTLRGLRRPPATLPSYVYILSELRADASRWSRRWASSSSGVRRMVTLRPRINANLSVSRKQAFKSLGGSGRGFNPADLPLRRASRRPGGETGPSFLSGTWSVLPGWQRVSADLHQRQHE